MRLPIYWVRLKMALIFAIFTSPCLSLTMPATITVEVTHADGTFASVLKVPFQQYCEDVLGSEWPRTAPAEALEAGAMAVKEFGWWRHDVSPRNKTTLPYYDVADNTSDQEFIQNNDNSADDMAVTSTWSEEILSNSGDLFKPQYRGPQDGIQLGSLGDITFLTVSYHSGIMRQMGTCIMAVPTSCTWYPPECYPECPPPDDPDFDPDCVGPQPQPCDPYTHDEMLHFFYDNNIATSGSSDDPIDIDNNAIENGMPDYVQVGGPPHVFTPDDTVKFTGHFVDADHSGTKAKNWDWNLVLLYDKGKYSVAPIVQAMNSQNPLYCYWTKIIGALPTGYNWKRNSHGQIKGKITVGCYDSDSPNNYHSAVLDVVINDGSEKNSFLKGALSPTQLDLKIPHTPGKGE